jgi:hypothetical protein
MNSSCVASSLHLAKGGGFVELHKLSTLLAEKVGAAGDGYAWEMEKSLAGLTGSDDDDAYGCHIPS